MPCSIVLFTKGLFCFAFDVVDGFDKSIEKASSILDWNGFTKDEEYCTSGLQPWFSYEIPPSSVCYCCTQIMMDCFICIDDKKFCVPVSGFFTERLLWKPDGSTHLWKIFTICGESWFSEVLRRLPYNNINIIFHTPSQRTVPFSWEFCPFHMSWPMFMCVLQIHNFNAQLLYLGCSFAFCLLLLGPIQLPLIFHPYM